MQYVQHTTDEARAPHRQNCRVAGGERADRSDRGQLRRRMGAPTSHRQVVAESDFPLTDFEFLFYFNLFKLFDLFYLYDLFCF